MDVDFTGDDSDGPEAEGNQDSVANQFKDLSDRHLDDEIEKYRGYATGVKIRLRLPDKGAKFTTYLHNLEKEKEAMQIKNVPTVEVVLCSKYREVIIQDYLAFSNYYFTS